MATHTGTYVTRVSRKQIEHELRLELEEDARHGQIKRESREFADEVRDTWVRVWTMMGPHPYETGDYADSIKVHGVGRPTGQTRAPKGAVNAAGKKIGGRFTGNIYAHYRVSTDNKHAGFIEYGTGWDAPDTHSPWGRFTPTPEFAPAAVTASLYGGTPD
jgi:hypothetical protein